MTGSALQAFRILAVFQGLFAGGTDQNFQQIFGNNCRIVRQREGIDGTKASDF